MKYGNKKGVVSLSINVLVIIIISLVILGLGVSLLFKFIGTSVDVKTDLDERTSQQIESLLVDKGQIVALPLHVKTVFPGSQPIFGIGVLNINDLDEFTLQTSLSTYIDEQGKGQTSPELITKAQDWLLYSPAPFTVKQNENEKLSILVNVPKDAPPGQYIFNAKIFNSKKEQYGNTQKFTVIVK